jgi:hypothetical protein
MRRMLFHLVGANIEGWRCNRCLWRVELSPGVPAQQMRDARLDAQTAFEQHRCEDHPLAASEPTSEKKLTGRIAFNPHGSKN